LPTTNLVKMLPEKSLAPFLTTERRYIGGVAKCQSTTKKGSQREGKRLPYVLNRTERLLEGCFTSSRWKGDSRYVGPRPNISLAEEAEEGAGEAQGCQTMTRHQSICGKVERGGQRDSSNSGNRKVRKLEKREEDPRVRAL